MNLLKVDTLEQVKQKLNQYFKNVNPMEEEIPLFEALGRYLAEDIRSETDIPEFARAVVDGYAVAAKDTFGVSDTAPVFLELIGEVKMGKAPEQRVTGGKTVYVPTGGMLPQGADAMVMVEYVEKLDEKNVAIYKASAPNFGLMNKGDDFKAGQLIYSKGHRITTKDIGMLAAMGAAFVPVFVKPTVAIISTGDEVISIMEDPGPGQVRDVNSYVLAALLNTMGAKVGLVALIKDSKEKLKQAVSDALNRNDIVLLSGGSSAGEKDYTAMVIDELGKPGVITHGIAMKPGKPTVVGVIKNESCCCHERVNLVVGLPGHPMAAIISYKAVVEPFIKKYFFACEDQDQTISARITDNIHGGEGRETFTLVKLSKDELGWVAEPIHAKSGSISQLRYADGYIRMSNLTEGINKNQMVEVVINQL